MCPIPFLLTFSDGQMDVLSKETQRFQIVCHVLYPSTPRSSEAESCRTETEPAEFSPFHMSKADGCSDLVSALCSTDLWARESQGAMRALFTLKEERQKQRIRLCFHLPPFCLHLVIHPTRL